MCFPVSAIIKFLCNALITLIILGNERTAAGNQDPQRDVTSSDQGHWRGKTTDQCRVAWENIQNWQNEEEVSIESNAFLVTNEHYFYEIFYCACCLLKLYRTLQSHPAL